MRQLLRAVVAALKWPRRVLIRARAARAEPHLRKMAERLPGPRREDLDNELAHLVAAGQEPREAIIALIRFTTELAKAHHRRGYDRMTAEDISAIAYLSLKLPAERRGLLGRSKS